MYSLCSCPCFDLVIGSLAPLRKHGQPVIRICICSCETQRVGHILLWGYLDEKGFERGTHVALCFCGWGEAWQLASPGQIHRMRMV